ncbi:HlyC/CorC family transporter [Hyphobacterium sp. CCMP332]|uniref:hemolysin family protein n=1 Tax=Hyphobacterium sp. CCMP332 TaxID=2749086 RepID=UPI00164F847E|nr:hemolysin family protein [Hyphobacterium sp. CCMP332]QNL18282.1 HlyC/CorC family transporter [Hyphobacterium sp. CCMP332]
MTLLIFYLLLALVVSFFCSMAEAVLLSVRPSYVAALAKKGGTGSRALSEIRENLDRPLAAILTANTIAHTVGAAGVGAQAAIVFGSNSLGVTSAVLTLLILVLSEIIPKTLGATHWKALAPTMAILIRALTRLLFPFVWMSERLTRLLSPSGAGAHTFSRDELSAMAAIGAEEGALESKEFNIVTNLLHLRKLSVRDIMTPRPVIFTVGAGMTVQDFFAKYSDNPFSRIPVFDKSLDDITGYVLKTDLLVAQARDEFATTLNDFRRDFLVLADTTTASATFDRLMHEKSHIGLVIDEFGTLQGLVTLEDVVETLIGLEITDELDRVDDMQALARERWRDRMQAIGIDPDSVEQES